MLQTSISFPEREGIHVPLCSHSSLKQDGEVRDKSVDVGGRVVLPMEIVASL